MRNPGNHARLKHPGRQMFSCGIFGTCADSVLSPTAPPALQNNTTTDLLVNCARDADVEERRMKTTRIQSVTQWRLPITREKSPPPLQKPSIDEERDEQTVRFSFGGSVDGVLMHFQSMEVLRDAVSCGQLSVPALRSIGNLAQECERNRELLFRAGVANGLVSILLASDGNERSELCEEAWRVLLILCQSQKMLQMFVDEQKVLDLAEFYLNSRGPGLRLNALLLLEKALVWETAGGHMGASVSSRGVMEGLVRFVREQENLVALKSAIKTLLALCLAEQNRAEAVKAGAVDALLEILPNLKDVSAERALATLDLLCTVSEGQCAVRDHALAIPLLLDMILKVSDRGTEYAASTLCAICGSEGALDAQETALQAGALTQLLLLLQSDCTSRAKRKALHLLKVLHKVWDEGSCNMTAENSIYGSPKSDNGVQIDDFK
eukprot:Gb_31380 [translate_table: standard]